MNITIVGCGNVGTQFAVHCANKGHAVTVFCSKPQLISKTLCIVDQDDNVIMEGNIRQSTNDAKAAFSGADLIFVTVPAFAMQSFADKIIPHINKKTMICLVPGTGGCEFAFKPAVENGNIIFGMQRVPSVARLKEYGKIVCASGYRSELFSAAIPQEHSAFTAQIISDIFDIPCTPMPNYLSVTLTPSNPILHTTRLKVLFKNYREGKCYDKVPLFYEEWNDESSELLLKCDCEVQSICKALKEFDLSYVKSLMLHYESETAEQLTQKIRSIKSFRGLAAPCIKTEQGYVPDFSSRYFTADFPFGLSILVQIANLLNLDSPNIKETLDWYHCLVGNKNEFSFENYNIKSADDLINFYKQ